MIVCEYILSNNSQYYGLKLAEDGNEQIMAGGKTWKTANGAERYAIKKGYEIIG